jgi:hypothetical protein
MKARTMIFQATADQRKSLLGRALEIARAPAEQPLARRDK